MANSLLPVLRSDHPAMSLCSICPKPGMCCQNFPLSKNGEQLTFWEDTAFEDAIDFLRKHDLPFDPHEVSGTYTTEDGRRYVTLRYNCPKLGPDGRCTIYATRPALCRNFLPGEGDICAFSGLRPYQEDGIG